MITTEKNAIGSEKKVLFDNLSTEFANVPKNRGQLEALQEKEKIEELKMKP